jgi:TonB family protein
MWWWWSFAWAAEPAPPSLVEEVAPIWPEAALAAGATASVDLLLSIAVDGTVTAATVVESGGEDFDRAAIQAARSFRFTPATDEAGRPVPVSIVWRTVFEPSRAPVVAVEGVVKSAGTRELVGDFDLLLTQGEARRVAITGPDGAFSVAGLSPGPWTVEVVEPGWSADPVSVEVVEGRVVSLTLRPTLTRPWEQGADEVSETVEVLGQAVAAEVTERTLTQEEARYLPGTNGDVVKVVQNLPGVARPPLGIGQLIIRGTAPEDSAYYLDGAPIPLVFHFAGFSTVLNGDAIEEIAFLPGNYGVRYGRTLGGVVDLRSGQELPSRTNGYVSVDTFQTTAFAEQRLSRNAALTLSGRRSYADTFLNPILNAASDATIRVPRYFDLQVRLLGRTSRGGTLDTLFLVSDDRFRVLGEDADQQQTVQIGLSTTFSRLRTAWTESLGDGWRHELVVGAGPDSQSFDFQDGVAYEDPFTVSLRDEVLRAAPTSGVGWGVRLGTDTLVGRYRFEYDIPGFGAPEGADVARFLPGLYAEATARLGALVLVPGVRTDAAFVGAEHTAATVDPRLAARVELGPTVLKASAGGYSQFPTVRQVVQVPSLAAQRSWQFSTGLEQRLAEGLKLEAVGFANRLDGLVSGREDAFRFFSGPPPVGPLDTGRYANDGVGTIVGLETFLRYQTERTAAWGSATFSRSTRTDRPGQAAELFDYDQPIVLTALLSQEFPKRWRLGARVRYSSGNPYTPVVNRFEDLDSRTFVPVFGPQDSARLPAFWSIDTRVDHDWVYRNWTLTAYLDLQNATNRQNVEVMGWTYDYAEEDPVAGIPLLPAFGFRGEW